MPLAFRFRRSSLSVAVVLGLVTLVAQLNAQLRGEALYRALRSPDLMQLQGEASIEWLPDGQSYLVSQHRADGYEFYRADLQTGQSVPLFSLQDIDALLASYRRLTGKAASLLPWGHLQYVENNRAILFTDPSLPNMPFLYDVHSHALRLLRRPPAVVPINAEELMRVMSTSQLVNGTYSPDYRQIAFIRGYDLYLMDTTTGREHRLTTGGSEKLMRGRPDWMYPDELGQTEAFWWSPDGKKIAYLQFDERPVRFYPIVHDSTLDVQLELQAYPLAGEPNPIVKIFILDLGSGKTVEVHTSSSSDVYIYHPQWLRDGRLCFRRLNRHQDVLQLLLADPKTGAVSLLLKQEEAGYINPHQDLRFLEDGEHFIISLETSGWMHLYLYDMHGKLVRPLTSGPWPIGKLIAVDEKRGWVYFTGISNRGLDEHLFRVRLDATGLQELTPAGGVHAVSMDPTASYFTDSYSSLTTLPALDLVRSDGVLVRHLATTDSAKLQALRLEPPELITVKAADGVTDLNGLLFKPVGYDPAKKYPLIVSVYGGPTSQKVRNIDQTNSDNQALAQLGYLVWQMDNRGTPNRGKDFALAVYLKIGQVDIADQAAGLRALEQQWPSVDASRVGVHGLSFGSYMTVLAMLDYPDLFHVGVAESGVTDWRAYDTIYSERYMRTPKENKGYEIGSDVLKAANLKGHLFLVFGECDNNGHIGNMMALTEALLRANKHFEMMIYPGLRHGIFGPDREDFLRREREYFARYLHPQAVN